LPLIAYPLSKDLSPYPKALREAIGLGGQCIRARSRPGSRGRYGAQGQAADTRVPCRPKGDARGREVLDSLAF